MEKKTIKNPSFSLTLDNPKRLLLRICDMSGVVSKGCFGIFLFLIQKILLPVTVYKIYFEIPVWYL